MSALPLLDPPSFEPRPLRPHQHAAIAGVKRSMIAGNHRIIVQLPTGAGKTRTAAEIVKGALAKGNRVCFTVPAISLIDQTVEAFEAEGIRDIGVIQANHPRTNSHCPVQVASVQTLARRTRPACEIAVIDECHLRFDAVTEWMAREPGKLFVGLSATPWAKGLADDWQDLIVPVRMQELIDQGYLSPFRVFAPSHPDLTRVATVAGDYHEGQLAEVMSDNRLVADVVQTWLQRAGNRPTLVFAVNRAHAAHLQAQFAEAGVRMGYCDAHVDRIERKILFDRVASGDLSGIVNVGTLTTGVDADIRCIVMARPTKSEMLFVQCIGRGLRTAPGKSECLILDHADNHARLGFVTDIHHDQLLSGKDKREPTQREKGEPMPKDCPSCGALKPAKARTCPSCGFQPQRQSEVEVEEGELIELKPKAEKFNRDDKQKFWSMALSVDRDRSKGGRLAKALYKGKFGVWPQGLSSNPIEPDGAFLSYERSRRIAYAKRRQA